MQSTLAQRPSAALPDQWVQQQRHLWTGRSGGRPIGTIEAGRRFTYVDVEGVAHRGFRTLDAAQRASGARCLPGASSRRASTAPPSRGERLLLGASTAAACSTVLLLIVAAPLLR